MLPEINDKESLSHIFNNKIRNKTRCISGWKKIDVRPIYDPRRSNGPPY